MIFVAIGAGGIYFTWRRKPAHPESPQPISDRAGPAWGQRLVYLFFLVFLLVGSGLFYGLFLRPLIKILSAKQWPAVPCVVISSEVKSHSSDHGTRYSVNILYRYEFKGREFKSNGYDFMSGSSSGYSSKQAIVSRHPPGTQTLCYVNPDDPTEAVLERGFTPVLWFGLIPLVFVLVGAGGLIHTVRKRREGAVTGGAMGRTIAIGTSTAVPSLDEVEATDPIVLKPNMSPWGKLLCTTLIALSWNGVVSVFVVQVVQSWRSGHPEWFLTLFMVPFVLVGLGLAAGIVYFFLALFNPRPQLRVMPRAVPLGGTLRVQWDVTGRVHVLERLRLRLQGREEATYRRGTNTSTDKSVFADVGIADVTAPLDKRSGAGTVTIPANLMHSFASGNNKIIWSIQVHGHIARWPDVKEEFPLTVLPAHRTAPIQS
jgi:hypothetical protein